MSKEKKHNMLKEIDFLASAKRVLKMEAMAIEHVTNQLDSNSIEKACELILKCKGKVVVSGLGKSGHISAKIAATMASTGTSAFFIHPSEACHGDIGMVNPSDVFIAISNSGATQELLLLMPILKQMNIPVIAMTGNEQSPLALAATIHINVGIENEACPLDLAPTSSTTACLAMGDAIAIALLEARNFTKNDFALSHPAGRLGKMLLLTVSDIMHKGDAIPIVNKGTLLSQAIVEMSKKGLGMTAVCEQGKFLGLFTDGDLRRSLDKGLNIYKTVVEDVMISECITIAPTTLAVEALEIMQKNGVNGFVCIDEHQHPVGAFNVHQLIQSGIV